MKKTYMLVLTVAVALYCAPAFAQHAGAGGGRPAGVGAPADVGSSSGRPSDPGSGGMGHSGIAPGSPTSVLDNTHATNALTNALAKSGVTIPGGDLKSTCSTFKNLGQCIAALHVAKNLNLTFSDLQTKMASESLGKAIQDIGGPNVNAKSEAKKANKQASQDLNAAQSAS
jgi:hypothetical protein